MVPIKTVTILIVSLFVVGALGPFFPVNGADAPRMTKEELRSLLGNPDVVILDVRVGPEWQATKEKIQGAVREDPEALKNWADKYPKDKTLVLYCS